MVMELDWQYWKWLTLPDSDDEYRLLRRKSNGATQLWEAGDWVDVPGTGLDHAINSGDLSVLQVPPDEAHTLART